MPRKKKPGSRGESPEKSSPISNSAAQYGLAGGPGSGKWMEKGGVHSATQQSTLQNLQEMFQGKVDPDVIYMVLHECEWKVNDAVEKLMVLAGNEKASDPGYGMMNQGHRASEPMDIQPRKIIDDRGLTMLSPKTPSLVNSNFPDLYTSAYSQESNMQYALQAIDSFANNPAATGYPTPLQRQSSYDPNLFDVNSSQSQNTFSGMQDGSYNPDSLSNMANTQQQHNQGMQSVPQTNRTAMYSGLNVGLTDQQRTSPNPQQLFTKGPDMVSQLSPSANIFVPSPPPPVTSVYGPLPQSQFMHPPPNVNANQQQSQAWSYETSQNEQQTPQDMVPNLIPSQSKYYQTPLNKAQAAQQSFVKRGNRKKTLSLNPEEREALENLIEDVIIGGVDEDVMDSDESVSSESEDDPKKGSANKDSKNVQSPTQFKQNSAQNKTRDKEPVGNARNVNKGPKGKEKGEKPADGQQKVYPPQLKVAVKHMKNLPPRFLRKLQVAPKEGDSSSKSDSSDAEIRYKPETREKKIEMNRKEDFREKEKRTKEVHKLEMKKKIRGMLGEGLDHYMDENQDGKKSAHLILPVTEVDEVVQPESTVLQSQHSPQQPADPGQSILQFITSPPSKSLNQNLQQQIGSMQNSQYNVLNHVPPLVTVAPGVGANKSNFLLQPNVVNCEELERELLQSSADTPVTVSRPLQNNCQIPHQMIDPGGGYPNITSSNNYRINNLHEQYVTSGQTVYYDPKSHFSVDAPEFVPRVFTPVTNSKPIEQIHQQLPNYPPQMNSSSYQPLVGRSSPHIVTAVSSANPAHLPTQEQLTSIARGSPAPRPAFIMPKMPPPPQQMGLTGAPPPPGPPPGVIPYQQYPVAAAAAAPTYRHQFPGFPPPPQGGATSQYPQFQGPFLVPAWSGGKKLPDLQSSNSQRSPFMAPSHNLQKVGSGMGLRGSSALLYATARPSSAPSSRINPGISPKLHRKGFYELNHGQIKKKKVPTATLR